MASEINVCSNSRFKCQNWQRVRKGQIGGSETSPQDLISRREESLPEVVRFMFIHMHTDTHTQLHKKHKLQGYMSSLWR